MMIGTEPNFRFRPNNQNIRVLVFKKKKRNETVPHYSRTVFIGASFWQHRPLPISALYIGYPHLANFPPPSPPFSSALRPSCINRMMIKYQQDDNKIFFRDCDILEPTE